MLLRSFCGARVAAVREWTARQWLCDHRWTSALRRHPPFLSILCRRVAFLLSGDPWVRSSRGARLGEPGVWRLARLEAPCGAAIVFAWPKWSEGHSHGRG